MTIAVLGATGQSGGATVRGSLNGRQAVPAVAGERPHAVRRRPTDAATAIAELI